MNNQAVLSILIPSLIVTLGWYISHHFTAKRDLENKRREQRLSYLVKTYRTLSRAANHPKLYEMADEFQEALSDIQFLGTREQVTLARNIINSFIDHEPAQLDPLLESLRNELRFELGQEKIADSIMWLRLEKREELN